MLYENNNSIFIAYANLGLQATYSRAFAGISIATPVVNGIEPSPTRFYLNAGYDWEITEGFSVEPSVMMNLNTNSSRMFDINVLMKLYGESDYFAAGINYRTAKSSVGSQQLSMSPIIKFKLNKLHFGASYNLGLSDIQEYGGNSFMLSLGYDIPNFINQRGFRYR